jgi:hypothetical protein
LLTVFSNKIQKVLPQSEGSANTNMLRQLNHSPLKSLMVMGFDPEKEILPGQEWFVKRK